MLGILFVMCSGYFFKKDENAGAPPAAVERPQAVAATVDVPLPRFVAPPTVDATPVTEKATDDTSDRRVDAWVAAEDFGTSRLKSSSTASFGSAFKGTWQNPHVCVTKNSDGTYLVKGWVDAQNTFGGMVLSNFALTVRDDGNGSWSLVGEPVIKQR